MRVRWLRPASLLALAVLAGAGGGPASGSAAKAPPPVSSFYDFAEASSEFELGIGNIWRPSCTVGAATQPAVYAGNSLIDCDAEVPHNETTAAANPGDAGQAAGGYHSYQLVRTGNTTHLNITSVVSATSDGGQTWRESIPPLAPYQFSGDPALAWAATGTLYLASIADHEGDGFGNFTGPSVVVWRSGDGGATWTDPVTVAAGSGSVGSSGPILFNDKEFIAADTGPASPFRNRVYVSWTAFSFSGNGFSGSPIRVSSSDDGVGWSEPQTISGFSPACTVQFGGGAANECDANQFSVPAVAPNGRVYVAFENFNTPAENQYMVVSSADGGNTWSAPSRVDTVFDINYPPSGLTGCQFRVNAAGNVAADQSDPTGKTLYVAWADNRSGNSTASNTDVRLARSGDGGATWRTYTIDSSRNDQFFPWVTVAPNGRVDVGYMDRSYSSGQDVCQYGFTLTRLTFGKSGKLSSSQRTRVDTGLSDPGHSRWFSGSTGGNSLFIGDYNGIADGPDGTTWSVWTDQRALVDNPPSPNRTHGQHAVATRTAP